LARSRAAVPQYCHHKPSGRAYVRINGKCVYLGVFNSPESRDRYAELIGKLSREGGSDVRPRPVNYLVAELCADYLDFAHAYYRSDRTGRPTDELACIKSVMAPLLRDFGDLTVERFDSEALLRLRDSLIRLNWSRGYINHEIGRVIRVFRWGVTRKLVNAATIVDLRCVEALEAGRSGARETRPRLAVSPQQIAAVRELLSELHRDVVDLLLFTGARPGELYSLTTGMIDRTVDPWRCPLRHHKTAHRGKPRILYFNASAQPILQRYLKADPHAPLIPGRRSTLGAAVRRACEVAYGMPDELRRPDPTLRPEALAEIHRRADEWRAEHCWPPYALRHTVATRLVDELGIDAAQALLGHCHAAMTYHYSKAAEKPAIDAVRKLG
jgi:integrase